VPIDLYESHSDLGWLRREKGGAAMHLNPDDEHDIPAELLGWLDGLPWWLQWLIKTFGFWIARKLWRLWRTKREAVQTNDSTGAAGDRPAPEPAQRREEP
jgi:hypothetical protein